MDDLKVLHERYPDSTARKTSTPIAEMVGRGESEQIVRKRTVYNYRPMYILAFVLCFGIFVWASAYTVAQLSDNATARACVAAGGDWQIGDQGASECIQS